MAFDEEQRFYHCMDGPYKGRQLPEHLDDEEPELLVKVGTTTTFYRSMHEKETYTAVVGEPHAYVYERMSEDNILLKYIETENYEPEVHD